jgi:hypothetical protein
LFMPWALPRETVSGFMGRMAIRGSRIAQACALAIDAFHWWEPSHCRATYESEEKARGELYGQD